MNMRIIGKNMRICMEYSPYLCTVKIIPCCMIPCRLPPLLATPPSVATQVLSGNSLRRALEVVIGRHLLSRRKFLAGIPCVVRWKWLLDGAFCRDASFWWDFFASCAGHRKQDTGSRTQEAEHRKQDTGSRTQEAESSNEVREKVKHKVKH